MVRVWLVLAAVTIVASGCVSGPSGANRSGLAAYREAWRSSGARSSSATSEQDYRRRLTLIRSPLFQALAENEQHAHLWNTAQVALLLKHWHVAHELLVRSSQLPDGTVWDWANRFTTARVLADQGDAVHALTQVVQYWPEVLAKLPAPWVQRTAFPSPAVHSDANAQWALQKALYHASWRPYFGVPPGGLWGQVAMGLAERGQVSEAIDVVAGINVPRALLAMRIDKRFDELVRREPALFDIGTAARREVEDWHQASLRFPRALDATVRYTYALLDAGQFKETYAVTSAVLQRVSDPSQFTQFYNDDETGLNWILDNQARALVALGRWKEAEWQLRSAADRLEHGTPNVSNVINLASFEANLGRGEEATRVLSESPPEGAAMTPYGRMQWYEVQLEAALEMGNSPLAARSLDYVREHQSDDVEGCQAALLRVNRLDEGAALLIRRLQNPDQRRAALLEVQTYQDPPALPGRQRERARLRQLLARPDVTEAIDRVGRVLDVPLPSPLS